MTLPSRSRSLPATLLAAMTLSSLVPAQAQDTYRLATTLGNIDVTLRADLAPRTVANFLAYTASGAYNQSLIHRAVPGFVIQGGGYTLNGNYIDPIATTAPVAGEFRLSNTRGTIAMALSTGPNSATSEWFFNLADNSRALDGTSDGGPFTAFGQVCDSASLAVMDAIGNAEVFDASLLLGGAFSQLPVVNLKSNQLAPSNLILVNSITLLSSGNGTDTYSGNQLTLPSIAIGNALYTNVVVTVGHVVSGPTGVGPASCGDRYDPASLELSIPLVSSGSRTYYNVVATAGSLVSIGGVSGADSYDGTQLTIPHVQVAGGSAYNNVVIKVAQVLAVAGGMPTAAQDVYNPATRQLLIPAVTVGGKVYTNVTVTVGPVVSLGP
jgi:cyclophilin family peptidyl-prolyl cis-trans isomerase